MRLLAGQVFLGGTVEAQRGSTRVSYTSGLGTVQSRKMDYCKKRTVEVVLRHVRLRVCLPPTSS